jgi:hypothetical protein
VGSWLPANWLAPVSRMTSGVRQSQCEIEHHQKRVRFFSTLELVNTLKREKMQ